ncbi:unnamed protein product, partial [Schistosoma turkestanicum]
MLYQLYHCVMTKINSQMIHNMKQDQNSLCCRVIQIKLSPTSSVTRLGEASLTYLNQGQTYELRLNSKTPEITFIKTCIRVSFYDKQMALNEHEHWNNWHQTHPGDNLLDI